MTGYGIPDRHLAAACNPMPYPVDLAGKPAPWTLPTKDALTIGAEYFDNVSYCYCYCYYIAILHNVKVALHNAPQQLRDRIAILLLSLLLVSCYYTMHAVIARG
jgi:hypothetical protein